MKAAIRMNEIWRHQCELNLIQAPHSCFDVPLIYSVLILQYEYCYSDYATGVDGPGFESR